MQMVKKMLCVFMSLLLCSLLIFPATACIWDNGKNEISEEEEEKEPQKLVVFVEGINADAILEVGTDKSIFPPATETIVGAVAKALPSIVSAIAKQDISVIEQPVCDAANSIFLPAACDEMGIPSPNTYFDWEWPDEEAILDAYESQDPHARVVYCYDWRLSMQTIIEGLHDYIEYVLEITGAEKVSLVGFSMGTCAVLSYLKMYDYEYIFLDFYKSFNH